MHNISYLDIFYIRKNEGDDIMCNKQNENNDGHVHEFLGSTMLAAPPGQKNLLHNHRFAGVSGPAIPVKGSHVHEIKARADFFVSHIHFLREISGLAIPVFDEKGKEIGHVHGFSGTTTVDARHDHEFKGATLIEDPLSEED